MSIKKIERNIIFSLTPPRLFQSKKNSFFLCRIKLSTSALARLVQQREENKQQRDDGTTENGEKREQKKSQ